MSRFIRVALAGCFVLGLSLLFCTPAAQAKGGGGHGHGSHGHSHMHNRGHRGHHVGYNHRRRYDRRYWSYGSYGDDSGCSTCCDRPRPRSCDCGCAPVCCSGLRFVRRFVRRIVRRLLRPGLSSSPESQPQGLASRQPRTWRPRWTWRRPRPKVIQESEVSRNFDRSLLPPGRPNAGYIQQRVVRRIFLLTHMSPILGGLLG